MKYSLGLISLILFGCANLQKTAKTNTNETTEFTYKLKTTNFPIEIIEAYVSFVSPSFMADNKIQMSYELTLLNNRTIPFTLKEVELYDIQRPELPIAVFDSTYLKTYFFRYGLSKENNPMQLQGNEFGVVNIRLTLEKSDKIPQQIFHKLVLERTYDHQNPKTYQMEVARMNIPMQTTISLGLPFKKGKWLYATSGHKDSRLITEGKSSYAQRFAIDWIKLDNDGTYAISDRSQNGDWIAYGLELLAVSDGEIAAIKDGLIDNTPLNEEMAIPINRETIAGNYIVIDIGNDVYAVYAHLIPNSIKVKVGEQVIKGQVIGLLGNSGNSDAPHLHFHLETKSNKVLGGEGLPYYFKEFYQLAKYSEVDFDSLFSLKRIPLKGLNPSKRSNELPIGNGLIEF